MSTLKPKYVELRLTAFEIARFGTDELYNIVDSKYAEIGVNIETSEMTMIAMKVEKPETVVYRCFPKEYTLIGEQ